MKKFVYCSALFALLNGCASMESPKPTQTDLANHHILTTTSGQGQIYVMSRNNDHYLCSLPQPDSAFDQKDGGNVDLSLISTSSDRSATTNEDTEEVELAGRTPAVLMTRELFFRACEFSSNYQLTKDEAKSLYLKTLDGVLSNWAIEAGHTTVTIGDKVDNQTTISNSDTQQTTSDNTESTSSTATGTATDPGSY